MNPDVRYAQLPPHLQQRIRGQPDAVIRLAAAVQRGELGAIRKSRPKGNFLLLGPTGTGKTETVLAITHFLANSDDPDEISKRLGRFDMAEYQNAGGVERLLGANKQEQGLFGDEVDRIARSGKTGVLLIDELEKAHDALTTIFLSAMDAARVTMANGSVKDLSNFYLCFTSNLGSGEASRMEAASDALMIRTIEQIARKRLRPELFARFDEVVVFRKLTLSAAEEIAQQMLEKEINSLCTQKKVHISTGGTVLRFLVKIGYHKLLGARTMRSAVERSVGAAWTNFLLGRWQNGGDVRVGEKLVLVVNGESLELRSSDPDSGPAVRQK